MQKKINVKTGKPYSVFIEPGLLVDLTKIINTCVSLSSTQVIICDCALEELYGKVLQKRFIDAGFNCYLLIFPGGENKKTRKQKQLLEDQMLALGCTRDTCVIAIGGGVTTDIAGYIAATYNRGVPIVYIPTSLLAMVDASIGGKTGVNTAYGKNLIGAFYQPSAVFIDPAVLKTLPRIELISGMAEVIKHALLADKALFEALSKSKEKVFEVDVAFLSKMISTNCEIKKTIVEEDEREKGKRQWLNLGHTIAHGLESASKHKLNHGKAVALGLLIEMQIAVELNIAKPQLLSELRELLAIYELPTKLPKSIDINACMDALKLDKKNRGKEIYFVFVKEAGKPFSKRKRYSIAVAKKQIKKAFKTFLYPAHLKMRNDSTAMAARLRRSD